MKVSVCTTVYNHAELLKGMIASVIGQSFKDWELIVVDDGSSEDIKTVCDDWNDERIKYHRFSENRGVVAGTNHAVSRATGEYVNLLAADERIDLNKLMWQVGYLDEHPEIGGIWGLPQNGPMGERPEWEQYALRAHNRSRESWIKTLRNLDQIPLGGASWLVRKSVLDDIGVLDSDLLPCSDLEMFIRFFEKYEGRVFPYRWAVCEDNPTSIGRQTTPEGFSADLAKVRAKHDLKLPPATGRVTVAIPVRNMEKYVGKAIQSVLDQTFTDFDLIVLDDASTDGTVTEIQKFADPRIRLMQAAENLGVATAQNQMLATANTEFFTLLAADDTIDATLLERCLAKFRDDPFLEFVGTQTDFMDSEGVTSKTTMFEGIPKAGNKPREEWLRQLWYGNQYFGVGMYRRAAALELGGWDAAAGVICDYDMYLKLLQRENIYIIEEPLTHTRAHDAQRSVLKTKDQIQELRQHYAMVKARYYQPRMKVIIATPFYEMRGFSPYIASIYATAKALTRLGIENEFWELSGDSYVDRAKNTIFNKFLEDPEATDIFMIDSDMQWDVQSVVTMLQLPEDIVMGSYPQKNQWGQWTSLPSLREENGKMSPFGRVLPDGSALIQAEWISGGYIRIKRGCLEKYKEAYKDRVYQDYGADPSYPERMYTEFFTCERAPGPDGNGMLRWGEDRVFGRRMKAIGIEGWIYPNVNVGHYGVKGWQGNYDKFLREGIQAQ